MPDPAEPETAAEPKAAPEEKPPAAPADRETPAASEHPAEETPPPAAHDHGGEAEHDAEEDEPVRSPRDQVRPGVYHVPGTAAVRLVRIHRWRAAMFEVFEFRDEELTDELRGTVLRQGGWRDENRQWYDLVEGSHARRFEILRRNPASNAGCPWEGWSRLGSRYTPARPCSACGAIFRHPDEAKTICGTCTASRWETLDRSIDEFLAETQRSDRLPKGSWQRLKEFREALDRAEADKLFNRVRIVRLRQKLHPIYRVLIERRRGEQEAYRKSVEEMEQKVMAVVQKSLASAAPERSVVEELKQIRLRLRELTDDRKLGIREFRKFIGELKKASENEERKFEEQRKSQQEREQRWEEAERSLLAEIGAIEVGVEHNAENWRRLIALKDTVHQRAEAGELGSQGRRRLLDMLNRLMDQEGNLRDMARQDAEVVRQVKKETSKKRSQALKRTVNNVAIGLGFSQELWDELFGIQKRVIQMKNAGEITIDDFRDVIEQVNAKLDTLKKLRGWGRQHGGGPREGS